MISRTIHNDSIICFSKNFLKEIKSHNDDSNEDYPFSLFYQLIPFAKPNESILLTTYEFKDIFKDRQDKGDPDIFYNPEYIFILEIEVLSRFPLTLVSREVTPE